MSTNSLKREVDSLNKALNINHTVPEWKKQGDLIEQLLKEYDELSSEEKQRQTNEVIEWYNGELSRNDC